MNQSPQSMKQIKEYWSKNKSWLIIAVAIPYLVTRIMLLFTSWFSQYFLPSSTYFPSNPNPTKLYSSFRYLDIWGRFDTQWYLSIVKDGYTILDPTYVKGSNIAFFPLYPMVVKFFSILLPSQLINFQSLLFIGVVISNICIVVTLVILYKLTLLIFKNKKIAELTNWFLLLSPGAFFLGAFYSESIFLMLLVATFYAAKKNKWLLTGVLGGLLAISRMLGVMIVIPILLEQLYKSNWRWKKIDKNILWLLLIPTSLILFFTYSYFLSGDFFAPINSHQGWQRENSLPWKSIINPSNFIGYITPLEKIIFSFFSAIFILGWTKIKQLRYYLIYTSFLLFIPLFTGTMTSMLRFSGVMFPVFMVLAFYANKYKSIEFPTKLFLAMTQTLLFAAWTQFYWVG